MTPVPKSGHETLRILGDDPTIREQFVLMAYFAELDWQADFALSALESLLVAGGRATRPNDFDTWNAAQSLLTALGIIRHLLLGEYVRGIAGSTSEERREAKKRGRDRGAMLRSLLDLPVDTVLLSAKVRNAYEHIDERLDEATKEPYMIDTAIHHTSERIRFYREEARINEIYPLRQLSLDSGFLHFGCDTLDLYSARHDLRLLKKRIIRACQRPRDPAQTAVGVFGHAETWVRTDDEGAPIIGDPFPLDPDVDG